jgi:chromosome segregation ATPase
MSIIDQFQQGVDRFKFKANQLSRISKLQNDIASLAGKIQDIRKQIVDTTIHLYNSKTELPTQLIEFCKNISQLENNISGIEQEINKIRAEIYIPKNQSNLSPTTDEKLSKCPHCTQMTSDDAEYCIHCGKKLNEHGDA